MAPNAFSICGLFVCCRELVNYGRARLADDLVLGIRASRTTDRADDHTVCDQRNAATRRNDSIEREQIVEMPEVDAVLENLSWAPEGRGGARLVLGI